MSLRIAYIGAGNFTSAFMFPQMHRHGVELAAVCSRGAEKAEFARHKYGFAKAYTDYRKMLETETPDAVFCVGGPKMHYEVGLEVLDRGFPLYIQKSPAPGAAETRELAEAARRRNVICHVGFNLRYTPAVIQAKQTLASAEFGEPLMGMFRYGLTFGKTMQDVVMDQHCHLIDLSRHLLGEVTEVKVIKTRRAEKRDYVVAVSFDSGTVGTLNFTSGQIVEKEFLYFEITGNGTFLHSHELTKLTWLRPMTAEWWKTPCIDHVVNHGFFGNMVTFEAFGYIGDVANFLAAVRGEAADLCSVADTVGTMEVCEEIYRQMEPALAAAAP